MANNYPCTVRYITPPLAMAHGVDHGLPVVLARGTSEPKPRTIGQLRVFSGKV